MSPFSRCLLLSCSLLMVTDKLKVQSRGFVTIPNRTLVYVVFEKKLNRGLPWPKQLSKQENSFHQQIGLREPRSSGLLRSE
jgi:hypothetical protein